MSACSYGRGRRYSSERPFSSETLTPVMREKRTADVVKSVLTKVRERALLSGPLLAEEETAITQLEQLFVNQFTRPAQEKDIGALAGGKRRESDQRSSPLPLQFPSRRDSDASYSNDTHSSYTLSTLKSRTPNGKERDYYTGRDPWRRLWQRRKRLELRKLVQPLPLRIDEANGVCLVHAAASLYDELPLQGKPVLAAYDLLITTLRSYFARETWPGLVDAHVVQFVENNILLSAAELRAKCSSESRGAVEQLTEYKLQALLHLCALPANTDLRDGKLKEVIEVLRLILSSFGGSSVLQKFLDEDVLETFLDTMPRDLAYLYQELNISLPSELSAFSTTESGKDKSLHACDAKSTSSVASAFNFTTSPRKAGRPRGTTKRAITTTFQKRIRVKSEANSIKKAKIERCLDDIEEVVEPKVQNGEASISDDTKVSSRKTPAEEERQVQSNRAPVDKEKRSAQGRPKKLKGVANLAVGKIIAETTAASAVLVSVRQSPRHHASTRALYGSVSNTLSLLLQKEQTDGTGRNGCLAIPATATELLNDSSRLVLVKDKRGYFLKKFLHDGDNGNGEQNGRITDQMPPKKSNIKKSSGGMKKKPSLKIDQQEESHKPVGKLTLKLKKPTATKKAATPSRQTTAAEEPSYQKKSRKSSNGRKDEHQRIVITRVKGLGDNQPSFILSAGAAGRNRSGKKEKGWSLATNNSRSDQTASPSRSAAKASKSVPVNSERRESGTSKSSKAKSTSGGKGSIVYALPSFAVENYVKHINEIRRERKRARIDPADGTELFYARGTRRHSIFYDGGDGDGSNTKASASKCYSDEQMAPKNRSGRKMKSSVEVFHLANYLLNAQNENPSAPAVPKNLQVALNTPIRLYKKLRLAPKNNRRRSLRQFCALKFNADEFKLSLDNGSGASNSSVVDEERSANEADECASLELNCGEPRVLSPKDTRRHDLKMTLTINTRLVDASPRRNSVSVCAGLAKSPPRTWTVNWRSSNGHEEHSETEPKNGYYLRRRRLFSDGQVSSAESSVVSPSTNERKRTLSLSRRREEFEVVEKKFKVLKNDITGEAGLVLRIGSVGDGTSTTAGASGAAPKKDFYMITDASLCGQLLDQTRSVGDGEESGGSFLNRLSSHAGGLLQLANPPSLLCAGLTATNYAQVAADVR